METLEIHFSFSGSYSSNNDELCKKINLDLIKRFLFQDDIIYVTVYVENNKIKDSINSPSVIYTYPQFTDKLELYTKNEKLHDEIKPSLIYKQNRNYIQEIWYLNDVKYRKNDLPCEIRRLNGNIVEMHWMNEYGYFHREISPSTIRYTEDGSLFGAEWHSNGLKSRWYGPSEIHYGYTSEINVDYWFYKGKNYTSEAREWIEDNDFKSWQDMTEHDYNRMWMEIL